MNPRQSRGLINSQFPDTLTKLIGPSNPSVRLANAPIMLAIQPRPGRDLRDELQSMRRRGAGRCGVLFAVWGAIEFRKRCDRWRSANGCGSNASGQFARYQPQCTRARTVDRHLFAESNGLAVHQSRSSRGDRWCSRLVCAGRRVGSWSQSARLLVFGYLGLLLLYRRLAVHYRLTTQRLLRETGILSKRNDRNLVIEIDDVTYQPGICRSDTQCRHLDSKF